MQTPVYHRPARKKLRLSVARRQKTLLRCMVFSALLPTATAQAQVTWTGSGGNSLWSNAANWSSNPALPGATDDVVNNVGATINHSSGNDSISSLTTNGILQLTGGILQIANALSFSGAGSLQMNGGTLSGATLSNPSAINFSNNSTGNVFSGVTLGAGSTLNIANNNGTAAGALSIANTGLTFGSGTVFNVGTTAGTDGSALTLMGTQTFAPTSGTATVNLGSATSSGFFGYGSVGGTVTIGTGMTIQGAGIVGFIPPIGLSGVGIVNNGTIQANIAGSTLNVTGGTFTNNGTFAALNGGTLILTNASKLGTIQATGAGSVVNLGGALTVSATDTFALSNGGIIRLGEGTMTGTLTAANAAKLSFSNSATVNIFNGVSLGAGSILSIANNNGASAGGLVISGGLNFGSGTMFNIGTTTVTTGSSLAFTGTQNFGPTSGTATVNLGSATSVGYIGFRNSAGTITLGSGLTVQGAGTIGNIPPIGLNGNMVNNGTIQANLASRPLAINTLNFTNNGILQANASGSTLTVSGTLVNAGTISALNGSTVSLTNVTQLGAVQADGTNSVINFGGTTVVTATDVFNATNGGIFRLNGGTLTGTLTASNLAVLSYSNSPTTNLFNGVTLGAGSTLTIANNNGTAVGGLGIANTGLAFGSGTMFNIGTTTATTGSSLALSGTQNFRPTSGTATVNLGSATSVGYFGFGSSGSIVTLGNGVTVQGSGTIGSIPPVGLSGSIVNNGTIQANLANRSLGITNAGVTNNGILQANASGSTLTVGGTLVNAGTVSALNGSTVSLTNVTQLGAVLADGTGSAINFGGTTTVTATDVFNSTNGGLFRLNGGTITGTLTAANIAKLSYSNSPTTNLFNNVTLGAGTTLNIANNNGTGVGALSIGNGVTFGNGTIFNIGTTTATSGSSLTFTGTQTFAPTSGTATVNLGSVTTDGYFGFSRPPSELTVGSGATIQGAGTIGNIPTVSSLAPLINNGTIQANISGRSLSVITNGTNGLTNNGVLRANASGSLLTLSGPLTNTGTIAALNGGTVTLGNVSQLGTVLADGTNSVINLGGTTPVTATSIFNTANGGIFRLSGGTLTGTLTAGNAAILSYSSTPSTNTFNGVTLGAGSILNLANNNGTGNGSAVGGLGISGGLTFGNGTIFNIGTTTSTSGSSLVFNGSQTFAPTSGTATVNLGSDLSYGYFGFGNPSGTLTIGSGMTVQGTGTIGKVPPFNVSNALINNGTIQANLVGRTLELSATTLTNNGTLAANNEGQLYFTNVVTNNGLISANGSNSTVNLGFSGAPANTTTGTIQAINGGRLVYDVLTNPLSNSGIITVGISSGFVVSSAGIRQSAGTTRVDGALTFSNPGSLAVEGGVLDGTGIIQGPDVVVKNTGGVVTAGGTTTAGTLRLTGTYTQSGTGIFSSQIGGLTQGSQYDFCDIFGTANLGGSLSVDLFGGYLPNVGDQFQILRATTRNGTFTNTFNGSPAVIATFPDGSSSGYLFQIVYGDNGVFLTAAGVVPEPSSWAFVLVGLSPFCILYARRRR